MVVSFRAPSGRWWNYGKPQDEGGNDCHIKDGAEERKDLKPFMKVSLQQDHRTHVFIPYNVHFMSIQLYVCLNFFFGGGDWGVVEEINLHQHDFAEKSGLLLIPRQ